MGSSTFLSRRDRENVETRVPVYYRGNCPIKGICEVRTVNEGGCHKSFSLSILRRRYFSNRLLSRNHTCIPGRRELSLKYKD